MVWGGKKRIENKLHEGSAERTIRRHACVTRSLPLEGDHEDFWESSGKE